VYINNVGKPFLLPVILRNMNKITLESKSRKARWENIHLFCYNQNMKFHKEEKTYTFLHREGAITTFYT
jgi:hypothetical protein